MSRLKYLLKRIKNMNFNNFFKTIEDVHERTGKTKIFIFFDMVICGIRYQAGYMDYQLFEMYKMNTSERKTIVTRGVNNEMIKRFNNQEYTKFLNNKILFNEKFDSLLGRDWLFLSDDNFDEFKKFIKNKDEIMVKPTNGTCGQGIEKIKVSDYKVEELYEKLLKDKQLLLEEVARQCDEISKLHPSSINTVRAVTLKGKVIVAFLRIGNCGYVVDNFNHDGLAAPIDIADGKIRYKAIDKKHNVHDTHPYTKEKIVGLEIPRWQEVVKLCEDASKLIPELGYVGWDICIGKDKLYVIEANEFPGHDIYQLPPHREGNTGLKPLFDKVIEEEK